MELSELLSNNGFVHTGFWLSWVCLALIAVLMFYIGEEASIRNTLLTILMPVDILVGTGCAYVGSGILTSEQAKGICVVIAVCAAAVIVLGVIWRSTTTVGLAAIGLEFTIISLRLFGGYTAQIMSAFIVLIAFMHGLKKYRESLARSRQEMRQRQNTARGRDSSRMRVNHLAASSGNRTRQADPYDPYESSPYYGEYEDPDLGGYAETDYYYESEEWEDRAD